MWGETVAPQPFRGPRGCDVEAKLLDIVTFLGSLPKYGVGYFK